MENAKALSTVVNNRRMVHSRHSENIKIDLARIAKELKELAKKENGMHAINILITDEISDIDPKELEEMGYTVRTAEDIKNLKNQPNSFKKDK